MLHARHVESSPARRLRTAQRASAVYDLLAVSPFAFPGLAAWEMTQLSRVASTLGLPGDFPGFAAGHLFFVNLFGVFVVVWSLLRLVRTDPVYALCDVVLRFAFVATILFYVIVHDLSRLLLMFAGLEVLWGAMQWGAYVQAGREDPESVAIAAGESRCCEK
jgi:hypothetical protein